MTRLPQPGADDGTWGDILNDFLAQSHAADGLLKNNSVTSSQIAPNSVTNGALQDGVISSVKLADEAITNAKISPTADIAQSKVQNLVTDLTTKQSRSVLTTKGDMYVATGAGSVSRLPAGANGQLLIADSTQAGGLKWATLQTTKSLPYSYLGPLATGPGTFRLYNDSGAAWTIVGVRASLGTAPTGSSVIVDVNKNGTSIFTTQANRPMIAVGANTSGKVTNMDVTTVATNEYLTVDIDQVGSTVPGTDLIIQVEVS